MADEAAEGRTFPRGDLVLDYWLANAEGLRVAPGRGRVVEVVHAVGSGQPRVLVVRSGLTGRRRAIPVRDVVAVQPWLGRLLLDPRTPGLRLRRATARAAAASAWLAPRAAAAGRATWSARLLAAAWSWPVLRRLARWAVRQGGHAASSARAARF